MEKHTSSIKDTLKVTIHTIVVEGRYFSFSYSVNSSKERILGEVESDHVHSEKDMLELLMDGGAMKLALEDALDKLY